MGGFATTMMQIFGNWPQIWPTLLASFMASLVEFVEALTVVLAVGTMRGWRPALAGTGAALIVLLALVAVFGRTLDEVPLAAVQLVIGTLVLLFGLRWLRKAILRSAGIIPLHNEAAEYVKQATLLGSTARTNTWDRAGFAAAFKIVMLEGVEVVFIVIAIAASGKALWAATIGAMAALILVIILGLVVHRPLAKIPENALKFGVGLLLTTFGTLWVGESLQIQWPWGDATLLLLLGAYFLVAQTLVLLCRSRFQAGSTPPNITAHTKGKQAAPRDPVGVLAIVMHEMVSLFVDDGALASGILAWVVINKSGNLLGIQTGVIGSAIFFLGFVSLLGFSATRASGNR